MKTPVFKVAKRNFDARYAEPINLTIDSTKNQLKRYEEKRGVFVIEAGTPYVHMGAIIRHELGYSPFFFAYIKPPGSDTWDSVPTNFVVPGAGGTTSGVYCGKTNGNEESLITLYSIMPEDTFPDRHEVQYKMIIYVDPNKDV